ncbi:JTB-like protein [Mya arenaria]|uniref:JTB-like protein n=1 Tax=Mya arenaria TaxID=6604 RepID=A0ABY7DWH6_MYAAR|nr:uncharacterized protein LOC128228809 [Mya arenaria]WAR01000.1 JTB-like protein [Mya arenaria]
MIEFCSRKRMVVAIVVLLSLTVLTLFVEGRWSTAKHNLVDVNSGRDSEENKSRCGAVKEVIMEECRTCKPWEQEQAFCQRTGYREKVGCGENKSDSDTFFRSCHVDPWVEERKFWLVEALTCLLGLASYALVKYRQSILDQQLLDKVNRQIAA